MPTLSLTDVVAGNDILAADINNAWASIESVVNAMDSTNWASGKQFAPNKISQAGATVGQEMTWDGTDWAPRTPLYVVQYNPTTATEVTTTSTSGADVDSTNLSLAVSLTSSGKMLVVQSAGARSTAPLAPENVLWGLRESTTDIAYVKLASSANTVSTNRSERHTILYVVTGLTAGAHTYKWAHKVISGTGGINYGTAASPAVSDYGPATMAILPYV